MGNKLTTNAANMKEQSNDALNSTDGFSWENGGGGKRRRRLLANAAFPMEKMKELGIAVSQDETDAVDVGENGDGGFSGDETGFSDVKMLVDKKKNEMGFSEDNDEIKKAAQADVEKYEAHARHGAVKPDQMKRNEYLALIIEELVSRIERLSVIKAGPRIDAEISAWMTGRDLRRVIDPDESNFNKKIWQGCRSFLRIAIRWEKFNTEGILSMHVR